MLVITLRSCVAAAALSVLLPLASIMTASLASGWFDPLRNALSDLGHAARSRVAPIFNWGLSTGGLMITLVSAVCFRKYRLLLAAGMATGYSLVLVAVFDEIYGYLHFVVSVAFFLSLAFTLAAYAASFRTLTPLPALAAGITAWILHIGYNIPKGAAIPELVSILLCAPFYLHAALTCSRVGEYS
ncbi:MAG: hypothetical protein DRJ57_03595 [Thermoprotei archaeon]|nr:MAG: hypothetical protein DRJ57_03595 [Thermoprotei archaeon]